jgi:serine/threonine protein phosphatase PrpC
MTPEWPLWPTEHPEAAQPTSTSTCPNCGRPVASDAAFCEECGATLTPTQAAAPDQTATVTAGSAQTHRLGVRQSQVITCNSCGGTIDSDGYCQVCGTKAPSARDHYRESPADWVGGVCDRGIKHPRNEDAMALWAHADRAVLVVSDGVSTSVDSDAAAMAAAQTMQQTLTNRLAELPAGGDPAPALAAAFVEATNAANDAIVAGTSADSTNAASATLAVAVVVGDHLHYANLGDSRVYFLGQTAGYLLSVDDSMAQAFIARGMDRAEAEKLPRAHAITKWLGRDSTDIVPRVGVLPLVEPGWVVVCSDGLWNYASSPAEMSVQLTAAGSADCPPIEVAKRLVDWANAQGGRDNVTVALAKYPAVSKATNLDSATTPTSNVEESPEHG